MSQEITLQQAAERAHQIEVICALAEDYPGMMTAPALNGGNHHADHPPASFL
ncbi:TPA: hypothetical protein ACROX7_000215 [Escherichia coli]